MNNYWLLDRPIAHRGFYSKEKGIPENSLPAFKRAIEHDFNIELDIQVTKDGKVVVFHDQNAKRMTGVDKHITEMTYEEFKNLRLDGLDINPPSLQEVFDLVQDKVGIVIELKSLVFSPTFRLERYASKELKSYNGRYCIKSFNPLTEVWFFNHHHKVLRGILSGLDKDWINKLFAFAFPFSNFISFNIKQMPNPLVQKCFRNRKKPAICWTVNSQDGIELVKKYADNIVFEALEADVVEAYYEYNKQIIKDYPLFKV